MNKGGFVIVGNPQDRTIIRRMPSLPASNHVLASGESTRYSGIYKLEHQSPEQHEVEKEIFIPKDTCLPFCQQCAGRLKFYLVREIGYIAEDPDFH